MAQISDMKTEEEALKYQLSVSGIPEKYWNVLMGKLENHNFDAGDTFDLLKVDYDEERELHEPLYVLQTKTTIDLNDTKHVYLIDHFWTFRIRNAKDDLNTNPSLITRLSNILDVNQNNPNRQGIIDEIFEKMWYFCNHYTIPSLSNIEDRLPIWYIMDEIGCAVVHSNQPNCRIVPFFYNKEQITYSILYPIEDVECGGFLTRDLADGTPENSDLRRALLSPYTNEKFDNVSFKAEPPNADYYLDGHIPENLPNITNYTPLIKTNYKVFTQYELIKTYLTDNRYEFVDNEDEADILWYTKHFKNYERLSETPHRFINQFPFEFVLTIKDLLCLTCRKSKNCNEMGCPNWQPITYNLKTEISNFFAYFDYCKTINNNENLWIIKPFNLARTLDTHITDNRVYITKLLTTGPKIAQKYITRPVLFQRSDRNIRVKFDIRYVILLKSVKPLNVYIYKNFFLRFANKEFQLNNFDDYQAHFTVMNYEKDTQMLHLTCDKFKQHWSEQYPNHEWTGIEKAIVEMLKEILECATTDEPPCGIGGNPQSRAIYAADILLEWNQMDDIQPLILEINFIPDCQRACQYYEDFYNQIFNLLFFDEESDRFVRL